jgi:hypothetical protein
VAGSLERPVQHLEPLKQVSAQHNNHIVDIPV